MIVSKIRRCWPLLLLGALAAGPAGPLPGDPPPPTCYGTEPTIVGTSGRDRLEGTSRRDVIVGLGGRDVIIGRAGDDLICGDRGDAGDAGARDRLLGGPGDDRLDGEAGHDLISGKDGADRLRAGRGGGDGWPNELKGGAGHDRLIGGPSGDLFWPGRGDDFAIGYGDDSNLADALYFAGARRGVNVNMTTHTVTGVGHDRIWGIDEVHGSLHADVLVGDEDQNYLWGECADPYGYCSQTARRGSGDVIRGKAGNDVLDGRAGPDRIFGGAGKDLVFGGFGWDTCEGEDVDECENA